MAKRRSTALTVVRSAPSRPTTSNIRISVPRATGFAKRAKKTVHRIAGKRFSTKQRLMGMAIGGLATGLIEKQFPTMPTMPMIGRKGTIAIAAYMLGGNKPGLAQDVCLAATVLASYEFGKDGKISGDDD